MSLVDDGVDLRMSLELIKNWAEHAAQPFQGSPRKDVEKPLSVAIGMAIRAGATVFNDVADIVIVYVWDYSNQITVDINPEKITDDMLVIRGDKWV